MEMEVAVVGGWRGWREQRWWWVGGEVGENNGGRGDEVGERRTGSDGKGV